jgi:hypothetical protein
MSLKKSPSPRLARLALRVGVTGHRPKDLTKANAALLHHHVHTTLKLILNTSTEVQATNGSLFSSEPPVFRIISPLAEGADRLVANAAMALGYELQCPLPFQRDEYAQDFATAESRAEYRSLLDQATAVLELDGSRETPKRETESYAAVGRMVLNQCDFLIAIWNGAPARGEGGTAQIVAEAMRHEIPTVWIQSLPEHDIKLLLCDEDGTPCEVTFDQLPAELKKILMPPVLPPESASEHKKPKPPIDLQTRYFQERQPRWTLGFIWKLFLRLLTGAKLTTPQCWVADFEATTEQEWHNEWQVSPHFPAAVKAQINNLFRRHYAWADKLADYYANLYRSSFVTNYLLAGLAVALALFAYPSGWGNAAHPYHRYQWLSNAGELVVILIITLITIVGNRKHWQERWIDYRLLAEHLRQMRFLAPLGRVTPFSRLPAHHASREMQPSWVYWYFRAIVRAAGMINARLDADYLEACRRLLHDGLIVGNLNETNAGRGIKGQVSYHYDNSRRLHKLDRRLHLAGVILFATTALACVVHFIPRMHRIDNWLTFVAAVLPAFGAAFYAIRSQGEFHRIVQRADAMAKKLEQIAANLEKIEKTSSSAALGKIAESAADCMITEVLDWRIMFQARPGALLM